MRGVVIIRIISIEGSRGWGCFFGQSLGKTYSRCLRGGSSQLASAIGKGSYHASRSKRLSEKNRNPRLK